MAYAGGLVLRGRLRLRGHGSRSCTITPTGVTPNRRPACTAGRLRRSRLLADRQARDGLARSWQLGRPCLVLRRRWPHPALEFGQEYLGLPNGRPQVACDLGRVRGSGLSGGGPLGEQGQHSRDAMAPVRSIDPPYSGGSRTGSGVVWGGSGAQPRGGPKARNEGRMPARATSRPWAMAGRRHGARRRA